MYSYLEQVQNRICYTDKKGLNEVLSFPRDNCRQQVPPLRGTLKWKRPGACGGVPWFSGLWGGGGMLPSRRWHPWSSEERFVSPSVLRAVQKGQELVTGVSVRAWWHGSGSALGRGMLRLAAAVAMVTGAKVRKGTPPPPPNSKFPSST